MNLKDFEDYVESKILERGLDYYKYDSVHNVEQIELGEFSATVFGSETYDVYVKMDAEQDILESSCDCPYDWGDICKHEVAVLYYLQKMKIETYDIQNSPVEKIKTEINQYSKQELMELIVKLSKENRMIRKELLKNLGLK